jgi:hypothetical protein
MTKPVCHCVSDSRFVPSVLVAHGVLGCREFEAVSEHGELVFHVVVGQVVGSGLCCEALSPRWRTDMMGRRTSLPATERCAAALEAHDGTYLVVGWCGFRTSNRARECEDLEVPVARAELFAARLRISDTDLPHSPQNPTLQLPFVASQGLLSSRQCHKYM